MHAFIAATRGSVMALDRASKVYTLLHIAILQKFKDDIALRLPRVKVVISLLIVAFLRDDTIFSLSHLKIVRRAVHTQGVGFCTHRSCFASRRRVGVYRYEEIGFIAVGYLRTSLERDKDIGLSSVDHLDIWTILLN